MKKRTIEIVDNGEVSATVILREDGVSFPFGSCYVMPFTLLGRVAQRWMCNGTAPKIKFGKVGRITVHSQ